MNVEIAKILGDKLPHYGSLSPGTFAIFFIADKHAQHAINLLPIAIILPPTVALYLVSCSFKSSFAQGRKQWRHVFKFVKNLRAHVRM